MDIEFKSNIEATAIYKNKLKNLESLLGEVKDNLHKCKRKHFKKSTSEIPITGTYDKDSIEVLMNSEGVVDIVRYAYGRKDLVFNDLHLTHMIELRDLLTEFIEYKKFHTELVGKG